MALPAAAVIQATVSTYLKRHEVVETELTREDEEEVEERERAMKAATDEGGRTASSAGSRRSCAGARLTRPHLRSTVRHATDVRPPRGKSARERRLVGPVRRAAVRVPRRGASASSPRGSRSSRRPRSAGSATWARTAPSSAWTLGVGAAETCRRSSASRPRRWWSDPGNAWSVRGPGSLPAMSSTGSPQGLSEQHRDEGAPAHAHLVVRKLRGSRMTMVLQHPGSTDGRGTALRRQSPAP